MNNASEEVKQTTDSDLENDTKEEKKQAVKDKYADTKLNEYWTPWHGDTDIAPKGPDVWTVKDNERENVGWGDTDIAPKGPDVWTVKDGG